MNCNQAKSEIALSVGNDLDKAAKRQLKQHLQACAPCHAHWKVMKRSLQVLQKRDDQAENSWHQSLWPILSLRLASRIKSQQANKFNGWLPACAIVAACLLMVTVSVFYPQPQSISTHPRTIITHPASASPWMGDRSSMMSREALIPVTFDRHYDPMLHDGKSRNSQPKRPPATLFEF